jgi:hypothetical protein
MYEALVKELEAELLTTPKLKGLTRLKSRKEASLDNDITSHGFATLNSSKNRNEVANSKTRFTSNLLRKHLIKTFTL